MSCLTSYNETIDTSRLIILHGGGKFRMASKINNHENLILFKIVERTCCSYMCATTLSALPTIFHFFISHAGKLIARGFWMLQAVSVIGAHHVIRVAILRALRYLLGYSHKTWIFRISRSSADAISVIRAGHYAVGVMPYIHSCANSVMNLAGALLRFPRAWRR